MLDYGNFSRINSFLYFKRINNEEKMMIDEFGNEYKEYMKKTGRLIPPFHILFNNNKLN